MGTFIGILLIELKLFGVALRAPVISFLLFDARIIAKIFPIFGILILYGWYFIDGINGFSKVNILTFIVIIFGAWVMLTLSFSKIYSRNTVLGIVKFSPIFFLTLVILQLMGFAVWVDYFSEEGLVIYPRSSGLSSEPSFFSNMLFYFFLLYFCFCKKNKFIIGFLFILLFLSTFSVTLVVYTIFMLFVFGLFKLRFGRINITPNIVLVTVFISLIFVERLLFLAFQESISHFTFNIAGSWREISIYSAIYGSDMIGPFNGGTDWADTLIEGQRFLSDDNNIKTWVVWPWSMLSMLLCEIGVIPTLGFIAFIGHRLNTIWCGRVVSQRVVKWYTLSTVIGIFLAPKWCVYFFFFPLLNAESSIIKNAKCKNN